MKHLLTIILLAFSLAAFADNPETQYCDLKQYGYLYKGNLYTAPFGLGWQFPKPQTGEWILWQQGYFGANTYKLQCNLPLDRFTFALLVIVGITGVIAIRRRYERI